MTYRGKPRVTTVGIGTEAPIAHVVGWITTASAATPDASTRARRRQLWTLLAFAVLIGTVALAAAGGLLWRASQLRHEQFEVRTSEANVTATLGTLLRRETDFVTTITGLATMQPRVSDSEFNAWYRHFQGADRQPGALGTAIVRPVPRSGLSRFSAKLNADSAYRALIGSPVTSLPPAPKRYCLVSAIAAIAALDQANARWLQMDWCSSAPGPGQLMAPLLRTATDTDQFAALANSSAGLPTMFIVAPVYRHGARVNTVTERRAASIGWVVSSFDVVSMVGSSIGENHELTVSLEHRNPDGSWAQMARAGPRATPGSLERTTRLAINGDWRVTVHGRHLGHGVTPDVQGMLVFAAGTVLGVLLLLLLLVLTRSRDQALEIIEQKTVELRHQANHDPLTGLPNRVLALDRAEQMLARARRGQLPIAALYLDVDGLKQLNDTFGHTSGDEFLQVIAERLQGVIRESDTVARLNGDEFVVLLDSSTLDAGPQMVAERILEVAREPYEVDPEFGRQLSLTVSIGLAYGLRGNAETLFADADVALNVAKNSGKNRYVVFQSGMQTAAQDRLRLEMDLGLALENDELFLVYQPTFDLQSERTVGAEALLRWRHPIRGVIAPDVFIPIAEESGLILPIGLWVLDQACRQGARWRQQGHQLDMSVNVSAVQLEDDEFIVDVRRALDGSGLEPSALSLEITETTLMRDADATAGRLEALKELGVRLAIDDFGTGYSSLAYLRQFPVDALKIDRSFIRGIAGSSQSVALIHTLVRLGKTLSLETLAEGIEDRDQLHALQLQECDYGQGYLFARPLEVEELEQFLDAQERRAMAS
jgi:diguanylate cyclase (GGDEF)-like protein